MMDKDSFQFIKENADKPYKWLAMKTGYSEATIRTYLQAIHLYTPKKRITEEIKKIILENKNLSGKELAIKLGISETSVSRVRIAEKINQSLKTEQK